MQASLAAMKQLDERVIRSKHVGQEKNGGIKIIYKNCASRWSSTHYKTMDFLSANFRCFGDPVLTVVLHSL